MRTNLLAAGTALLILLQFSHGVRAGEEPMPSELDSTRVIFDFVDAKEADQWAAVNDNVMGGLSDSKPSLSEDSCLVFSGTVSLENNGGFASIRTLPRDFDLDGYAGIKIRVKGDGRTYQFRLRGDRSFDGVAFKQEFRTVADKWTEIVLPFASFLPTYRGRILSDVPPIDASAIRQIGFLIADKTAGPFILVVDNISAYR